MLSDLVPSIIAMVVCVILSAYFSATETSFSSLNKTRLKAMAEKDNKKAQLAYKLSENYDKLISTILIGNNIVNITLASIGTIVFVKIYGNVGATISTVVITVVVLIFGEITPKSIAKDMPENFAMFSAPFINFLIYLLMPLNFIFSQWKKLISKLIKVSDDSKMSQEELLLLVEEVQQDGSIDETEGELLKNAIEFGDLDVQDILTHRVDLEAVSITATHEEIAAKFDDTRFSRLLVFDDTIDNIVGVLHQKDFYCGMGITDRDISEIMTPPVLVHQTVKINDLLQILQTNKSHIAIVIDEYGGTLGIVTMEDILEELVGDIWDEHDEVIENVRETGDNTYIVDCSLSFSEFCDKFEIDCESDSVSLGGWIMEQLDKIPEVGDSFEYLNITVTVTETDSHRVSYAEVVVTPLTEAEDDSDDEDSNESKHKDKKLSSVSE